MPNIYNNNAHDLYAAFYICNAADTDTYFVLLQGIFEILSLTGSFMPTENGFTKSRSGGLSVQLATTDGRVMGGGLAGLLIAATPVRVIFVVKYNISDRIFKNFVKWLC